MVNRWNGLVDPFLETRAEQVAGHGIEHSQHQRHLHVRATDEAAIREAAVADETLVGGVSGQQGAQAAFGVADQQGMITEAVGVIVHVRTLEQEGAVLAGGHEGVPLGSIGRSIALHNHDRSALEHSDAEAGRAVAIAVVKHQPLAMDIDHGRVTNHLAVPARCGASDTGLVILARPAQTIR